MAISRRELDSMLGSIGGRFEAGMPDSMMGLMSQSVPSSGSSRRMDSTMIRGVRLPDEQEALEYASNLEFEIEQLRKNLQLAQSNQLPLTSNVAMEVLNAGLSLLDDKMRPEQKRLLLLC